MKQVQGMWLPDSDEHMAHWWRTSPLVDGKPTYQYGKVQMAVRACRRRRTVVDVGAHVGTWSRLLAREFERVVAFEPVPEHRACFERNLAGVTNVHLLPWALGNREGLVATHTNPTNTGETWIVPEGEEPARPALLPLARLDQVADLVGIVEVDLLKVDCEGYEVFVLKGAEHLVWRDRPVILVEQDERYAPRYRLPSNAAVEWLKQQGYRVIARKTCDYLLIHPRSVHWPEGSGDGPGS